MPKEQGIPNRSAYLEVESSGCLEVESSGWLFLGVTHFEAITSVKTYTKFYFFLMIPGEEDGEHFKKPWFVVCKL